MFNRLFSLLLFLFSAALSHAGTYWELEWGVARGSVTYNGRSLGAYTMWGPTDTSAGQWSFQSTNGVAYASIEAFPLAALDPTAPVGTFVEYKPSDPAADDFFANLYLPYVDPANPTTPAFEYFRYLPGSIDLKATVGTGETVQFNAGYQFQDPAGGIANYTVSGVVGGGTGNSSFALKDGLELITGRESGTFFETPEPAAVGFVLTAVALFGWMSRRRRSVRRS
jgi:hypothetical protein